MFQPNTSLQHHASVDMLAPITERRRTERLPTPLELRARVPLDRSVAHQVASHRDAIRRVLSGEDSRLLVVVGPCSLHDDDAAIEYAERLAYLAPSVESELLLVMRAYVEKPRTTVGWKGMVYDPELNGSGDLGLGLLRSRRLMMQLVEMGLPLATELLQPMVASYLDDLLSWAAIGARTSESQVHRELVSGLDMPVGFKNGTDGSVGIACDAMRSACRAHLHFGVDSGGHPAMVETTGNSDTHLVLRGGNAGPNYDADSVGHVCDALQRQGIDARIMVDCSHANSGKDPLQQPRVLHEVVTQRLAGNDALRAVMLESHINDGAQAIGPDLAYGVSITDGCLGWAKTEQALLETAARLRDRHP
jgi:3-deoxy-7-phosphoheptulonate synthase